MSHKHLFVKRDEEGCKCACGTILCMSVSPVNRFHCNLKKEHKGLCKNSRHPEGMRWKKKREVEEQVRPQIVSEAPLLKIVVTRRSDDYMARLDGCVGVWGNGKSPYAAIGNMVNAHRDKFGVTIDHQYPLNL